MNDSPTPVDVANQSGNRVELRRRLSADELAAVGRDQLALLRKTLGLTPADQQP